MTGALRILDISLFAGSVFEVWARICWKSGTCGKCRGQARLAPGLSQLESNYPIRMKRPASTKSGEMKHHDPLFVDVESFAISFTHVSLC